MQDQVSIIGITNTSGSPLSLRADAVLLTCAGEEHSVSCKTYVTALAALNWLGEVLIGGDPFVCLAEFEPIPDTIAQDTARLENHVEMMYERLFGIQHLWCTYK